MSRYFQLFTAPGA